MSLLAARAVFSSTDPLLHAAFLLLRRKRDPESLRANFQLATKIDTDCLLLFRFSRVVIRRLVAVWRMPKVLVLRYVGTASASSAACLLLRRFAYPARLSDLVGLFGQTPDQMSRIFRHVVGLVFVNCNVLLNLNHRRITPAVLRRYAGAITAKGAPLRQCFAFIDGTVRAISRPARGQRKAYNGHKRIHALKFQSVVAPDGLIIDLHGPEAGNRLDAYLLAASGIERVLERHCELEGVPYVLYGDPAYPISTHIAKPFAGAGLTPQRLEFNRRMSAVREAFEWGFGKITQYFRFVDFKAGQKVLLSPVGKFYLLAGLLANSHTCLYGSLISRNFVSDPPALEEYNRTATHHQQ
jgi:hypothetical protein